MAAPRPKPAQAGVQAEGYWGPVTSSIDWCEENYVQSYYIAEFWNTITNAGFIALGGGPPRAPMRCTTCGPGGSLTTGAAHPVHGAHH